MSTLAKRANGPQMRMLRIVSGAVLNAAHAHPNKMPDRQFARSVAKRAVGTLSAQWPETLAAESPPPSGNAAQMLGQRRSRRQVSNGDGGGSGRGEGRPFTALCARLGKKIKLLRIAGDHEAAEAVRAAIAQIAPIARREQGKPVHTNAEPCP